MNEKGKQFSIFKRKNGKIYYCQLKKSDGSWTNAVSTGKTNKFDAEQWAIDKLIKTGGKITDTKNLTFQIYAKDFFDYNGAWATDKKIGSGISKSHCIQRAHLLNNHLLPSFGKLKIKDIDRAEIKKFRNDLYNKGYSGNTINKCLSALKTILETAEEQEIIPYVPRIDRATERPKQKAILTPEEVRALFSFQWMSKPSHKHPAKPLFVEQAGNRLAIITGVRLSELQGLLVKDVNTEDCYITIKRAWDNFTHELKDSTKTKKERIIFFPKSELPMILELIEKNPHKKNNSELFLFYSNSYPDKPKDKRAFTVSLYNALEKIGISEEERKERNITFHSHRHYLNSLFINNKIPLQKVQQTLGHNTMQMSAHYYHKDDMNDVVKIQESIFH